GEVLDLADLDAAVEELGAGGVDVGDDHLEAGHRPGLGVGQARAPGGGAGGRESDEAEVVADMVVVVGVEADLLGVEALGPVHVGDGDRDQLELPVHGHVLPYGERYAHAQDQLPAGAAGHPAAGRDRQDNTPPPGGGGGRGDRVGED